MFAIGRTRLANDVISHHQRIHVCPQKAVDRLARRAHNRLVVVEGSIDQGGDARQPAEFGDQPPKSGIGIAIDRLQAAGAVYVRGGRQRISLFLAEWIGKRHKRRRMALFEKLSR